MAQVRQSGFDDDFDEEDREEPFRVALPHESRHSGTIAEISEVHEVDDQFGDGTYEQIILFVEADIEEDLDIPDENKEQLREAASEHFGEETDTVQFPLFCKANITRGATPEYNDSKLYETLYKLDLVEAEGDAGFQFLSKSGEKTLPFDHVDPEDNEAVNSALEAYLEQNATGLQVEWEAKNANQGTDDEYSVIGKIVRRED